MSSGQFLKQFINERLTAAADEIFRAFEKTISNYEDEMDRYRTMLEIVSKPEVKIHRVELPRHSIEPGPRRPGSSHHGEKTENICIRQVVPKKEGDELISCRNRQEVGPIESEVEQEEQSSPVVLLSEDRHGNEDGERPKVKVEEDRHLLQPKIEQPKIGQSQLNIIRDTFHCDQHLSLKTSDCGLDQCKSKTLEIKEKHQRISTCQESVSSPGKEGSDDMNAEKDPERHVLSHHAAVEGQGWTQSVNQKTGDNKASPTECVSNNVPNCHPGKKSFKCDTCGKSYLKKSQIQSHMKVHTSEKRYSCETCGKKFPCFAELYRHQVVHTGEKPYSCEICEKSFAYKFYLNEHMKIHTGENLYTCEMCSKTFLMKNNLRRHMKVHRGAEPVLVSFAV